MPLGHRQRAGCDDRGEERIARSSKIGRPGDACVVIFATGLVVRELVVALDDQARRFSYAAVGGLVEQASAVIKATLEQD